MCDLNSTKRIWSYTTCSILPSKMSNELKVLLSWKPIPHFWIISVRRASLLPWKCFLVEEKEFSVHGKCPNFSMRLRLRTRGKLMLANFRLKIRAVWDSDIETELLDFLTNKMLSAGAIYIRFLIYLKAIYVQKMKEIDFSTLATKLRFWSIFPDRRS